MKKSILSSIVLLMLVSANGFSVGRIDTQDDISNYIKAGNSKEIAKYFAATVSISILDNDDMYPKAQAESVLRDFFAKHPPVSVKPLHKLSSNPNHKFTVVLLHTSGGDFRVSFSLRNNNGEFELNEIRIEPNKD